MTKRRCWDCHWRQRADHNGEMSTCFTRQLGGVLVRDSRVVADGFNGNLPKHPHCSDGPQGCPRCHDPKVRSGEGLERCYCCHVEQNIVSYCAKNGVPMDGTVLFLPATPCLDCFKLVALSGVMEIVYSHPYPGADEIVRGLAVISGIHIRGYKCAC